MYCSLLTGPLVARLHSKVELARETVLFLASGRSRLEFPSSKRDSGTTFTGFRSASSKVHHLCLVYKDGHLVFISQRATVDAMKVLEGQVPIWVDR